MVKSSQQLKDAYQTMMQHEMRNMNSNSNTKQKMTPGATTTMTSVITSTKTQTHPEPNWTVLLSNGKYSVDLQKIEHVNKKSHFLWLVQRRDNWNTE